MTEIQKIAVLVHEHDRGAQRFPYIVWHLQKEWESRGLAVELVRGVKRVVEADILFPQIDLSVIPDAYLRYFENYRCVVNRNMRDIRKTSFSPLRVEPGDGWAGPVIVKSNLNYGGLPEVRLGGVLGRLAIFTLKKKAVFRRLLKRGGGLNENSFRLNGPLNPHEYPVFERVDYVPEEVFANPALVVERFLQEPSQQGYTLRSYNFLGERGFTRRRVSSQPIVKASNSQFVDAPPLPGELVELRKQLGFDYGKIDYLVHDGKAVPLDINTTPTIARGSDQGSLLEDLNELAMGIEDIAKAP